MLPSRFLIGVDSDGTAFDSMNIKHLDAFIPAALLVQFASLLGYHAYLKMRYLLLMNHGAAALIVAFAITLVCLLSALREGPARVRKRKKSS